MRQSTGALGILVLIATFLWAGCGDQRLSGQRKVVLLYWYIDADEISMCPVALHYFSVVCIAAPLNDLS